MEDELKFWLIVTAMILVFALSLVYVGQSSSKRDDAIRLECVKAGKTPLNLNGILCVRVSP